MQLFCFIFACGDERAKKSTNEINQVNKTDNVNYLFVSARADISFNVIREASQVSANKVHVCVCIWNVFVCQVFCMYSYVFCVDFFNLRPKTRTLFLKLYFFCCCLYIYIKKV